MAIKNKRSQDVTNNSNYKKKIEELKLKTKEKELFIKSLEDELLESKEIINNQRKKIDEIEGKTKDFFSNGSNQNEKLNNQYTLLAKENEEMKAKLKKVQSERDIMKKTNYKLMKQIKSGFKDDKNTQIYFDKISKENQDLQTKIIQYETQFAEKDITIKDLNQKILKYEYDLADSNRTIKGDKNNSLSENEKEKYEKKIRELEIELGKAEGQLGSLEGTIMMHEEENIILKEENSSIKKQIDVLKASKELKGNMGTLRKRVAKLEQQLEEANKINQEAQNTINLLKKKQSDSDANVKSASVINNEEILGLKDKIAMLELDLEVATLGSKEKDSAIEKQEKISKDYEKKINELQKKINDGKLLESKLMKTSDKLLRAENELNLLKNSSFETSETTKKYKAEQETSNKEIKKYKELSNSLKNELNQIKNDSNSLKQQIKKLEKEKELSDSKVKKATNLEKEKAEYIKEVENLKEKIKQNNMDLDKKEAKIIQLTKEIEDAKTKENESIEKYEILMKKIEDNQKEVVTSAKKISKLTQEINDAKKKISQYENELTQANETIKKLESELKEEKNKWEESILSREKVIKDVTNQNEGDVSKLEKENKKLLEDLAKEKQTLKECQIREQNLINESKSFEEKLKMISIELNEKSILSTNLAEQINQLQKEQENSQKKIKENENKLIVIQEQLDATIRERDEKLVQYNKLERQLEDNKQLLDQFNNSTIEEKNNELAIAAKQIETLKKTILLQEEDLSKMEKLEKEKLVYETNIKQLKNEIEKIQNNNQSQNTTRNINDNKEMEEQINQLKVTLELMNDELSQKNTELEIVKKAAKTNEENNCELKEKIKDYEVKVEEIKNLKEKMKDYDEKVEELGKLKTSLKDYNETIEELKKLKESVKDYNEKVEELNKLRESVKDYNEKVEELNKLRESVKDYNEKVEELNKLRESVKDYKQRLEDLNKLEASLTEKSKSVKADNNDYTEKDREIDELKTKCAELEITTLEDQLRIQELEDSLNYQQTEFESLESSWDDLKRYVGELEQEIETSHVCLKEKKEKLVALESQVEIMKKKLETTLENDTEQSSEQTGEVKANEIKVVLTEKEMCNLQPYLEKAKAKDKTKNKNLSELIVLTLSSQEKEIDELKLKLDQNILKFNSENKSGSFIEDEKSKKDSQNAESLREQNLQLAKELAETKSQFKAREIEVEKVTDSLFNQISTLENEFLTLEEGKNSIIYDFKQYKYTVQQEMKQLVEKHSTEEERKQLELEVEQREKDQLQNSENEEEIVDDIYKIYIDKLDESLTNKDKEISNMNQTMSENQKEMDTFKDQLVELEKAHQELIQVGNNAKKITQLDPSILEEKVSHIKNLEISLGDAKNKIKSFEKSQNSLMEQNKKLNDELEKAKEETRKLTVEVDDARRSETVKVIREITTYDASDSELSQGLYICQQKLKAANKEIQELLTTISEQKKTIEKMNNELSQLRSDLEKTNVENYNKQDLLNNQIINLNYKLNNAKIENQDQKKTILELEQAAARISANNINAAAEKQYPIESQTIQQYKDKIEFLQNRIESLQNEKRSEEEASRNNIDSAKARIVAMENLMIAYRNKIAESNKKALAAETQIQEQNQEIDRLYNEIDIAHSQLQEIERQVGRTIPSSVVRIQDVNESNQQPISSSSNKFIDFINETFSQIESNPLNEEISTGKFRGYNKTMANSDPIKENKNIGIDADITNNDGDALIINNNQLENDPLIRDCMNIFSTLDNMNLNFTPDFIIEKDVDGVSSSKDFDNVKLEEEENKEINYENKETNKEDVIESNSNEAAEGVNKTKEILATKTTLEQLKKDKVEKEKITHSDSIQLPNSNEEMNNKSESVLEISENKETNKICNEQGKSTLQPIAENELLTNTTLRTSNQDDIADISIIDPNESINTIRKNKSLISVFGKRNKKSKKTHHKTESIASEHSSISNISQATSNGKKKRTSIINFLISKN